MIGRLKIENADSLLVAFCSFFQDSLAVFHRCEQLKSRGRQQKSSIAGQQNNVFIFWPHISIKTSSPKFTQKSIDED